MEGTYSLRTVRLHYTIPVIVNGMVTNDILAAYWRLRHDVQYLHVDIRMPTVQGIIASN